ncbi:hypothetical protein Hanom_Chr07g00641261 [Helianthus anomalus]
MSFTNNSDKNSVAPQLTCTNSYEMNMRDQVFIAHVIPLEVDSSEIRCLCGIT